MALLNVCFSWWAAIFAGVLAIWVGYHIFQIDPKPQRHRFGSFAPVRNSCDAKWFVDGEDYMSSVADAVLNAKNEIYITDWCFNPHIFMKRPDTGVNSLDWRLDKLLLRKADEGVRVFILLYWESKEIAGMDLGSSFAQSVLKHRNIKVLLHPDTLTVVHHPLTMMRWSHHEKVVVVDRSIAFVGGIDLCFGRWDTHNHELTDDYPPHPCVQESKQRGRDTGEASARYARWVGKDYGNTFLGGSRTDLDKPLEDYVDRGSVPRMPWHDVACMFTGLPASDVAKHFIQRYNALEPSIEDVEHSDTDRTFSDRSGSNLKIQVLRSVDNWSAGQPHEASIYSAYLHAIKNAEHFIYIENQFFISSQSGTFRKVENKILTALVDRITHAYKNAEDFHVIVIMPLKPEFPGEWGTESGGGLRAVSYWTYATIYNGKDSLMSQLKENGIPGKDVRRYFSVYGLRTHGTLNGNLVTEVIYVHSKLMIVDDRLALIGSANINDRSMLGGRDSEVAVIIEDVDMVNGEMNGQPYLVGRFSHSLRCRLLREHLGLLKERKEAPTYKLEDPLTNDFHTGLWSQANENTNTYRLVFYGKIDPTNHVWNYRDLENWKKIEGLAEIDLEEAKKELKKIRGSLVLFPVFFLKDVLKPDILDYLNMYVDTRGQTSDLNFDNNGAAFA